MIWQLLARAARVFPREGCESRCVTTLNTITAAAIVPATLNHGVVGHRRMLSRRAINDAPAASIRFLLPSALIETGRAVRTTPSFNRAVNMIRIISSTSSGTRLGS